jgi:hypothetical protein
MQRPLSTHSLASLQKALKIWLEINAVKGGPPALVISSCEHIKQIACRIKNTSYRFEIRGLHGENDVSCEFTYVVTNNSDERTASIFRTH